MFNTHKESKMKKNMFHEGYKIFDNKMANRYNFPMEVGKVYTATGPIKFGNNGNGFHYCKNLVDVFRYHDSKNPDGFIVTKVLGFGETKTYNDEYYGYYDMYVSRRIYIIKQLSREEIIKEVLTKHEIEVLKFLTTFSLTPEEITLFKKYYSTSQRILNAISYYQEKDLNTYSKIYQKK